MAIEDLISLCGDEIDDPEEETFLLFSQDLPSQNLGFIDAKAVALEITVAGKDLIIHQSPTLLSSNRDGGTTGAVVWRITPLFAEWIALDENILSKSSIINQNSTVLELGCGISGIVGLSLASKIERYVATDQEYVFKLLKQNLEENLDKPREHKIKSQGKNAASRIPKTSCKKIQLLALDWESSIVSSLKALIGNGSRNSPTEITAIVACDCIYNEALVDPFVSACREICHLAMDTVNGKPTVCIIAQQLRSASVFEAWLSAFHKIFKVWRVPDQLLIEDLKEGSGFVIHIGILR